MKIPTFERFVQTFTNGVGKPERRFIEQYGSVSFEEAYPIYIEKIAGYLELKEKINKFENFLINEGAPMTQSNISESRYYQYNGVKYRFSAHVYPTGSMTSDFCIDFAANPEMIKDINF